MGDFLTGLLSLIKSGSLAGAVNLKDLGKAARTAAIVGGIAALGSIAIDAQTLDYGTLEVGIVALVAFAADALRRLKKDNT